MAKSLEMTQEAYSSVHMRMGHMPLRLPAEKPGPLLVIVNCGRRSQTQMTTTTSLQMRLSQMLLSKYA